MGCGSNRILSTFLSLAALLSCCIGLPIYQAIAEPMIAIQANRESVIKIVVCVYSVNIPS